MSKTTTDKSPEYALIRQYVDRAVADAKKRGITDPDELKQIERDTISGVSPIALSAKLIDGYPLDDEATFHSRSVLLAPVVNPLFHALMVEFGAVQTGQRSYRVDCSDKADARKAEAILRVLPAAACYTDESEDEGEKESFLSFNSKRYTVFTKLYQMFKNNPAHKKMSTQPLRDMRLNHPTEGPISRAAVILRLDEKKDRLSIKVCTTRPLISDDADRQGWFLTDEPGSPDLNILRPSGVRTPARVTPDQAVAILEEAKTQGFEVLPNEDMSLIRTALAEMVIAQSVPGAPGGSRLVVGNNVEIKDKDLLKRLAGSRKGRAASWALVPAGIAGNAVEHVRAQGSGAAIIDPAVKDVIRMALAAENPQISITVEDETVTPREYQIQAVSLHAATELGFLQACAPGLGKTPMTLWGMRLHAEQILNGEAEVASAPRLITEDDEAAEAPATVEAEAEAVPEAPEAPEAPIEAEAPSAKPTMQTLTCSSCGEDWEREAKRGRRPTVCPTCK